MTLFIDTNVIVSHFMPRGSLSVACTQVFVKAEAGEVKLATTASNLLTTMYLLGSSGQPQRKVDEDLKALLGLIRLVDVREAHFNLSFASDFKDKEDGVIYHAALGDGRIDRFVTHNVRDFRSGKKLTVVSPEQLLNELDT